MKLIHLAIALGLAVSLAGCRSTGLAANSDTTGHSPLAEGESKVLEGTPAAVRTASAQLPSSNGTVPVAMSGYPTTTTSTSDSTSADAAYAEAMAQLEELGREDPAARDQLWLQLQTVKPSLWPGAVQQYRSRWQQHRALTGEVNPTMMAPTAYPHSSPVSLPAPHVDAESDRLDGYRHQSSVRQSQQPELLEVKPALDFQLASHVAKPIDNVPPPTPSWLEVREQVMQAGYESTGEPSISPPPSAPRGNDSATLLGWRGSVDSAIEQLDSIASPEPRNRHEAYLQAKMRLLKLVAGDKEGAVRGVPGLTPTEQSYWSHQLMAIATLLDNGQQTDTNSRVSLAARHLEDAAAQLSELADLQVRNLVFFEKLYGFGDYDAVKETKFKANQQVKLYVEVDNYRSDSTAEGYRTVIDSSYEIVDASGHRVEGAEFASVIDRCRSRRRDFYVEYTLNLPERVYPGNYQLKLTLHDRLADKLGSQTIDFEIVKDTPSRR